MIIGRLDSLRQPHMPMIGVVNRVAFSRLIAIFVLSLALAGSVLPAQAQDDQWRHGLSLMGELKYPPGFKHFDYVNPQAPKGGTVRLGTLGGFDNFNIVVAGVKGQVEGMVASIYEPLFDEASDEVSTEYGRLAEAVKFPPDFSSVTYRLRKEARWHDGKPVTPEDVIYSFEVRRQLSPLLAQYYRNVTKVEKTGEREVTFTFDSPGNRELPLIIGQLTVLPKHWWEGTDKDGRKRNIAETTLEPPLGSGPYSLKSFVPGRSAVYERVKDYWGRDLPVNVGRYNFDELRVEYFRDMTVMVEAFKGDQIDWRSENSARNWATGYDIPAVREGRIKREEFPIRSMGVMQAFVFNLRRPKFQDARLRRAFNYAFDFEDVNRTLFYGQYQRIASYFSGLPIASSGLPEGREKAILEGIRDKIPADIFTKPYTNPVGGTAEASRANLREALRLLGEAGYELKGGKLVSRANGEQLSVELLGDDPNDERIFLFYKPALEKLGMAVTVRIVDDAQYQNRLRSFDFDIATKVWPQSLSPGNEQRDMWGSAAAERPGSQNLGGIKNPAVDALIEHLVFAKNRDELVASTKALDRVLLANDYVVPQWTYPFERTLRWDRFDHPKTMPEYGASAFPTIWWWKASGTAVNGARP